MHTTLHPIAGSGGNKAGQSARINPRVLVHVYGSRHLPVAGEQEYVMKFGKTISAIAVATILAASSAWAGQVNNANSNLAISASSGPGYGAALSGGVVASTAMSGLGTASTSVQGLTTAQSVGHAGANAAANGSAASSSLQFHGGGLHW